jgi:replication initiation protein RepC
MAHKDCSPDPARTAAEPDGAGGTTTQAAPAPTDSGTLMRLTIEELLILVPRLRTYLTIPQSAWRDIVDAADWLRGEMGISRPLWGEACLAMGRECAAVAVALVSARPAEHFRTSPGGYFHGMVAKAGKLNLVRTIWGLRQAKATRERVPRTMH